MIAKFITKRFVNNLGFILVFAAHHKYANWYSNQIELILNFKKESSITVVSVLNDIKRAYELATRIIYVANGQALNLGTPSEAKEINDVQIQKFLKGEPSYSKGAYAKT